MCVHIYTHTYIWNMELFPFETMLIVIIEEPSQDIQTHFLQYFWFIELYMQFSFKKMHTEIKNKATAVL